MFRFLLYLFSIHLILLPSNIPVSQLFFYFLLVFIVFLFFINGKKGIIDINYAGLFILSIISLILNDIPNELNSEIKFVSYSLVLLLCSSFIDNNSLNTKRKILFKAIEDVAIFTCVICLFGLLIGVIPRSNPGELAGGFSGIFKNSITFGCLSGISIILVLNKFFYANKKIHKIIYFSLTISFLGLLILSGSRAALVSTIFGLLLYLARYFDFNIGKFLRKNFIYVILCGIILGFLLVQNLELFEAIINKNEQGSINSDAFYSRRVLWESRINEFFNSPIYGVGFNSIQLTNSFTGFHPENGTIEAGSSWLFILSSLGLLGGIIYFRIIVVNFLKAIFSKSFNKSNSVFVAIVGFFIINMLFEGYIFATSNVLTYILFLAIYFIQSKKIEVN